MAKKQRKNKAKKGVVLFLAITTTLAFTPFLIPPSLFQQEPPEGFQQESFLDFGGWDNDQDIQFEIPEGMTEEEFMEILESHPGYVMETEEILEAEEDIIKTEEIPETEEDIIETEEELEIYFGEEE